MTAKSVAGAHMKPAQEITIISTFVCPIGQNDWTRLEITYSNPNYQYRRNVAVLRKGSTEEKVSSISVNPVMKQ